MFERRWRARLIVATLSMVWASTVLAVPVNLVGFNLDGVDVDWSYLSFQMRQVKNCQVWAVTRVAPDHFSLIVESVTQQAPDEWQVAVAEAEDGAKSFIAVDSSRFEMVEQKASAPWGDGQSTPVVVKLRAVGGSLEYFVVLLDLAPLDGTRRMVEMLNVNQWVRRQALPTIVVGGFVDGPGSVSYSLLTEKGVLKTLVADADDPKPCPGATHDDVLLGGATQDWQVQRQVMFPMAQYCSFAPEKTSRHRPLRLTVNPVDRAAPAQVKLDLSATDRQQILDRVRRIEMELEALKRLLGADAGESR